MENAFNDLEANVLKGKIEDFLLPYEPNYMLCFSNEINEKEIDFENLKARFEDKTYHLEINDIVFCATKTEQIGNATFDAHPLVYMQNDTDNKNPELLEEIEWLAQKGENIYKLHNLFISILDTLDDRTEIYHKDSWVRKMNAANNKSCIQVRLKDGYYEIPFNRVDLSLVYGAINLELYNRWQIVNEFKNSLIKIYRNYLFLPKTIDRKVFTYSIDKTDIVEILVFMEEQGEIKDFQYFKAIILEMLNIKSDAYTDAKNKMESRPIKFKYISSKINDAFDVPKKGYKHKKNK